MAYLDASQMFSGSAPVQPALREADGDFTALEWGVIALARRESLRSLTTPGPVARTMGGLFGLGASSRLADARLEALRRMSVYAWRRGFALPQAEIDRFMAAGFSQGQLERLVESVTGLHIQPRARVAS